VLASGAILRGSEHPLIVPGVRAVSFDSELFKPLPK
jgi:hypothetical protein